jgi:hypothetical protein
MKLHLILTGSLILSGSLLAAQAASKDEVIAAAKKLGAKANYSWKTTVTVPEGSRFRPGPVEGQTEKDGLSHVSWQFGDNSTEAVIQGEKAAVTNRDGEWQSVSELENAQGPGRFLGIMVRNFETPADQAARIAADTKDLKKEGDAYAGDLTEDGAKALLRFRRRGGDDGPSISNAKGSAKFWVQDGTLSKFEYKVQGTIRFNDNDREVDRTTTVEIKDVGTTKVNVPEAAKKKLS